MFHKKKNLAVIIIVGCFLTLTFCIIPEKLNNFCPCKVLETPIGKSVTVNNISELYSELSKAAGSLTIFLEKGTYPVSNQKFIKIQKDFITIRSKTGKKDDVIIVGEGMDGSAICNGILIKAKNVTIADLTIKNICNHGIQIAGEVDADNCKIHNVHFVDIKEQMIKISKTDTQTGYADNGIIECCIFEFTNSQAPHYYTGGVDGHRCSNWVVKNNVFKNIKSPENRLSEYTIHFWGKSKNISVLNNKIINCDRGIGFGQGEKNYQSGGLIANNMVYTTADVGIALESASFVKIYNNTLDTKKYTNSIELRFSDAKDNQVINNLISGNIKFRDGSGQNTVVEKNFKYELSQINTLFKNASQQDYHLIQNATDVIDKGKDLKEVVLDFDCEPRPEGLAIDIGADEWKQ